jgi:ectoine hydroxylase-related dioxygenase (phytanoyl-CoA dioxygenase family)
MSVEANTARSATDAQREEFERDGFLVVDGVVPEATIDAIVSELADLYGQDHHERDGVTYFRNRIQDAWKINEKVKGVALAPTMLPLLEDLYGRRPLPFQTINFRIGTQQKPHSDALHFSTVPEGFMAGVWIAFEDMDPGNGPLVYYPGSHKLPFVRPADFGAEPKWENYSSYEDYVGAQISERNLAPQYGTIRKGQALIWSANLLHGGAPQEDRSRSRHSQVTHYFFEGCRYYTPMVSEGDNVRWRDPVWIA